MSTGRIADLTPRQANLVAVIETALPDFVKACRAQDNAVVIMHQDAFAADYQEEEYRILGMAIKFAGICGREIRVTGRSRETVESSQTIL